MSLFFLVFCFMDYSNTQWLKIKPFYYVTISGVRNSSKAWLGCSVPQVLIRRSLDHIHLVGGLVWKPKQLCSYVCLDGGAGRLDPTGTVYQRAFGWSPQLSGLRQLHRNSGCPARAFEEVLGGSEKASYKTVSKLPACHVCCILLIKQVTKTSPDSNGS